MIQTRIQSMVLAAGAFFSLTAAAFAGVTVSAPAPGATSGSPVHFSASAVSNAPVVAMAIYIDGRSAFSANSAKVETDVAVNGGGHSVVVQAWDSHGNVLKNAFGMNVNGGAPSAPPSGPVATFSTIEALPGWADCTVCAGAGGNGPSAAFGSKQGVSSPSLNGRSMQFFLGGSTPYSNAIWWKQLGADDNATHFQYDLDFYLTTPQNAEALEFDVNQSNGPRKFIFGTQCNIRGGGVWDVWDTAGNVWRPTSVACALPAAFQWHHLTWEFFRDSSSIHFVAVTLDGAKHFVNQSYSSKAVSAHEINVAFQMDGDFAQQPYSAWLNNVTLRYW